MTNRRPIAALILAQVYPGHPMARGHSLVPLGMPQVEWRAGRVLPPTAEGEE
ncbi:hypothetical protein [Methylobacterium indicum]|uniref:hypothetical protein n=1 Tax=Methylobacterium indicum TaxID=1775910 RepID=UPI000B023FD5|nr:hypothetical protein [Methylobacterium indicum]